MLYPLLLVSGLLTPAVRPVVSVPPPQFIRPSLRGDRSWRPLPTRGASRVRYVTAFVRPRDDAAPTVSSAEAQMVRLLNDDREARGLAPLTLDADLVRAARGHCRDMRDGEYFDHDSPLRGQRTPLDRYRYTLTQMGEEAPASMTVGENILYRSRFSRNEAVQDQQALMGSPGHRANILDGCFTRVGVGVLRDAEGEVWVTQMFLRDSP